MNAGRPEHRHARSVSPAPAAAAAVVTPALAGGPHRLALQISDNDPEKMNAVLNVAANVSRYYSDKGEEVEIQIVAFNAGLHLLRDDTSPVKPRIAGFSKSMPNVSFKACQNTIDAMAKREGKADPDHRGCRARAGGRRHADRAVVEKGWTIVRP